MGVKTDSLSGRERCTGPETRVSTTSVHYRPNEGPPARALPRPLPLVLGWTDWCSRSTPVCRLVPGPEGAPRTGPPPPCLPEGLWMWARGRPRGKMHPAIRLSWVIKCTII